MMVVGFVILTVVLWMAIVLVYWRKSIFEWFDNRWGPQSRVTKPKGQRRRMYE